MASAMEFAAAVAAELGRGWASGPHQYEHSDGAQLIGPDGVALTVKVGNGTWHRERGRVCISWWCPEELRKYRPYDDQQNHDITVAETRPAKQVAGEIKRRLLPLVLKSLNRARDRKAASDRYEAEQDKLLGQVMRALGGLAREHDKENNIVTFGGWPAAMRGEIKVGSGDDMLVELRIKRELLPSLAVTLAALANE